MNYEQFEELYSEVINYEWNDQEIKHILVGSLVRNFIDLALQEDY